MRRRGVGLGVLVLLGCVFCLMGVVTSVATRGPHPTPVRATQPVSDVLDEVNQQPAPSLEPRPARVSVQEPGDVVQLHVVLLPFDTPQWDGLSSFGSRSMSLPEDVTYPADRLGRAIQELAEADAEFKATVRAALQERVDAGEDRQEAWPKVAAQYRDVVGQRDQARVERDRAALAVAEHVWDPRGDPWASWMSLQATSRTAWEEASILDVADVERRAQELLSANPDHPVADHVRLLLANIATDPNSPAFDPELAASRIADLVDLADDESSDELLREASALMVALPGDTRVEPWVAEVLVPEALATNSPFTNKMLMDYALQFGERDLAEQARVGLAGFWDVVCDDVGRSAPMCVTQQDGVARYDARMVRAGWADSQSWQVDLRVRIQSCHEMHAVDPGSAMTAVLRSAPHWQMAEVEPAGAFAECIRGQLSGVRAPQEPVVVALTVESPGLSPG